MRSCRTRCPTTLHPLSSLVCHGYEIPLDWRTEQRWYFTCPLPHVGSIDQVGIGSNSTESQRRRRVRGCLGDVRADRGAAETWLCRRRFEEDPRREFSPRDPRVTGK